MKDVFVLLIMTKNQLSFQNLSPKVFANTFTPRNQPNCNLRHITCFKMPLVNSAYSETESIAFLGPKVGTCS